MTSTVQTLLALGIAATAALSLGLRALAKRKNPGCGGDCGCPASEIRQKTHR